MELDRCRDMPPPVPSYGGLRERSRSPEPSYASRAVHVEVAELKDKLEQTSNELRRTQAELRLNQTDYDRSHAELEQMQEKVCLATPTLWPHHYQLLHNSHGILFSLRLRSHKARFTDYERNWKVPRPKTRICTMNWKKCNEP